MNSSLFNNKLYNKVRRSLKSKYNRFDMSRDELLEKIYAPCEYCGAIASLKSRVGSEYGYHNTVSLIDSFDDYTMSNTITVCATCSVAKGSMSHNTFSDWINKVYKRNFNLLPSKTPGELIDALITTDIKCFMFQEDQLNAETLEESGRFGNMVMEMNRKRNRLTRALDILLGFSDDTVTPKTYLNNKGTDLETEF